MYHLILVIRGVDELSDSFALSDEIPAENGGASKKRKKEKTKGGKISQTKERASGDEASTGCKLNNFKTDVWEEKIINKDQDLPVGDELKEKLSIFK